MAGAVVAALGLGNGRTVLVDGRVGKLDGRLVDHDLAALRATGATLAHRLLSAGQRIGRPPVTATRAPEM